MPATIVIADDSPVMRYAIRRCLEATGEFAVCAEAANGKEAIEAVAQFQPDVLILDLQMPVMTGLEAAPTIRAVAPNTAILLFTLYNCEQLTNEARRLGIKGVISKDAARVEQLVEALRQVNAPPGLPQDTAY
jgi:two-component system, NarL family, nitrate/nitrite response regulator NarL